jgi:hypothetical protein
MPAHALTGFNFGALVDAGLTADRLAEGDWHVPDGYWHASALADCPRAQVLKRAGIDEGHTRSSLMTFELGHAVHASVERWAESYAAVESRFQLICTERGFLHPTLNLKAKPDMIGSWEGEPFILEIKTERGGCPVCKRGGADHWRRKQAEELGYPSPVDSSHWLQATASAMCAEPDLGPIAQGRILYVTKNDWFLSAEPVALDGAGMRDEVARRVRHLDECWQRFVSRSALPLRLADPDQIWRCAPRRKDECEGEADMRGRWCTVRAACMQAPV